MVWTVKTSLWLISLALIWLTAALVWMLPAVLWGSRQMPPDTVMGVIAALSLLLASVAVGQLCGMIFPRGITAGLIALVVLIAVLLLVGPLFGMQLMPAWVMLGIPLVILAVSFSWSGEWLLDRAGAWRWVKLGLLLVRGVRLALRGLHVRSGRAGTGSRSRGGGETFHAHDTAATDGRRQRRERALFRGPQDSQSRAAGKPRIACEAGDREGLECRE